MAIESNILLESGTNELEIVEFKLNNDSENDKSFQSFGINVAKVREIIRMPAITKLPNLPNCVLGIFTLRDRLIPALDLNKYLYGNSNSEYNRKMIIAEFNKMACGFIVNDVHRIHRISWTQIEAPDTLNEFNDNESSIIGIIKFDDRNILMIDIEKIIADIDPNSAIDIAEASKTVSGKPIAITAEDSSTIRKMITDKLVGAGFEIKSFNDGESAWNYLNELSSKCKNKEDIRKFVDVIVTDIEMPKMDGYTLTKNIKSDLMLSQVPVVIFSSIVSQDVMHKGKSVGADAQLTKPQIGILIDTIYDILEKK
jgi:two-component system, chemotaxis family, chemotaxis protein CheV